MLDMISGFLQRPLRSEKKSKSGSNAKAFSIQELMLCSSACVTPREKKETVRRRR